MIILLESLHFYEEAGYIGVTANNIGWYGTAQDPRWTDSNPGTCEEAVYDLFLYGIANYRLDIKVFYTDVFSYTPNEMYKYISKQKRLG